MRPAEWGQTGLAEEIEKATFMTALSGSPYAWLAHPAVVDQLPRSISTNRSNSRIQARHEFRASTFCYRDREW
jgi:hypothetical protein